MKSLIDEDHSVRREAVGAVGTLGELAPTKPLIAALEDDHLWVCEAAFQALEHQR